jgi:hypothetical protein
MCNCNHLGYCPTCLKPLNHPPPMPEIEFSDADLRELEWAIAGGGHLLKPVCIYFQNVDRGLDCTAQNCPCELYEADK